MLAKGPVAPFLAAAIIVLFAAVPREWRLILKTVWLPGIALFCAMALPWYVAVQLRNPQFFREFLLEQSLPSSRAVLVLRSSNFDRARAVDRLRNCGVRADSASLVGGTKISPRRAGFRISMHSLHQPLANRAGSFLLDLAIEAAGIHSSCHPRWRPA